MFVVWTIRRGSENRLRGRAYSQRLYARYPPRCRYGRRARGGRVRIVGPEGAKRPSPPDPPARVEFPPATTLAPRVVYASAQTSPNTLQATAHTQVTRALSPPPRSAFARRVA